MPKRIDITNQRFGKLTALSFAGVKTTHSYWNCICDCGVKKEIRTETLRSGRSKSCGCRVAEVASKTHQGKVLSFETKKKIGDSQAGERGNNWNKDLKNRRPRLSRAYKHWRDKILLVGECQKCGSKESLVAHHGEPYRGWEDENDTSKGFCLCFDCHKEFHSMYGFKSFSLNDTLTFTK